MATALTPDETVKHAEEAIRESETRFRCVVEGSMQGIMVRSWEQIQYANAACARIFGYDGPDDLVGQPWHFLVAPEEIPTHRARAEACLRGETVPPLPGWQGIRKDGKRIWLESAARPFNWEGQPAILGFVTDITERKQSEECAELNRLLTENSNDLIYLLDLDGRIVYASPSIHRHCGVDVKEVLGTSVFANVHPDDITATREVWSRVIAAEGESLTIRLQHMDGAWRWIEVHASRVPYRGRTHVMAVGRDVNDRKRSEEELVLFRALIDQSNDGIEIVDPETGRFLDVNEKACQVHGYTREEYLALTVSDIDPIIAADSWPANAENLRRTSFKVFQNQHKRKDGSIFPVEVHVNYIHLHRDYILAVVHDTTDRKRAEQRNAAQHAVTRVVASAPSLADAGSLFLQAICEALEWDLGGLWHVDAAAQVLRCVQTCQKPLLHAEEFDLVTRELTFAQGVCLPGWVWSCREPQWIADVVQDPRFQRAPLVAKLGLHGGLAFPILFEKNVLGVIEFFSHEIKKPDEDLLRMMADIGSQIGQYIERKRTEEAMRVAQERLQHVVSSSPAVLYKLAIDEEPFRLVWVSDNIQTIMGYSPGEAMGPDWWEGRIHPDDRTRVSAITNDGIQTRADFTSEYRFKHKDGTYRWVRSEKSVLRDVAGNPKEVIGSWSDITERKQLEDQFRQAQKMEAIGKLAGGVAHDFNNLLTVILGYSDIIFERLPAGDPLRAFIDEVRKSGARAASLTRQLLAFSRKQILVPEIVDLNSLAKEMEKMLTRLIGEDIELTFVEATHLGKVKVDRGQMEQVIMNLVVNARDAMPQGGKLTVETANAELDENYTSLHSYTPPGSYVLVSVNDTGCGMDEATRLRVFEPFFTTKIPEKGTGLGLSTVYGIVKQSNGFVEVYSEVGKGSSFKVYLPRVGEELPRKKSRSIELPRRSGAETVLLVEDESGVRTLARLVLEKDGFTVLEARNGCDALLMSQQHAGAIHIMVTDVVMPDMSGPQLAKQLTALRPDMKVLFLSGYTDDAIVRHGIISDDVPFLQKPFTKDGLLKKVRHVLAQSSNGIGEPDFG